MMVEKIGLDGLIPTNGRKQTGLSGKFSQPLTGPPAPVPSRWMKGGLDDGDHTDGDTVNRDFGEPQD